MWSKLCDSTDKSILNTNVAFQLAGPLNAEFLKNSILELTRRHEALRTSFQEIDGQLLQVIDPEPKVRFAELGNPGLCIPVAEAMEELNLRLNEPLHLSGPLSQYFLYHCSESLRIFAFTIPRLVIDAWSLEILLREISTIYNLFAHALPVALPPVKAQLGDYAEWEQCSMSPDAIKDQISFWRRKLHGVPRLRTAPQRFSEPPNANNRFHYRIVAEEIAKAESTVRNHGRTLFVLLMSIYAIVLSRLSGQTDLLVACYIANRQRQALEETVGHLTNTIPLRIQVDPTSSVEVVMDKVEEAIWEGFQYSDVPFATIVKAANCHPTGLEHPMVQTLFAIESDNRNFLYLDGVEVSQLHCEDKPGTLDVLTVALRRRGNLDLEFEYRSDVFSHEEIASIAIGFEQLLRLNATESSLNR